VIEIHNKIVVSAQEDFHEKRATRKKEDTGRRGPFHQFETSKIKLVGAVHDSDPTR
jgi:hypothetical protein